MKIFLDRDGVMIEERDGCIRSIADLEFIPGALEGIRRLAQLGFEVAVVTNQAIIGRGQLTTVELDAIHRAMESSIESAGGKLRAVYYCPHRPEEGCACRKPEPGLILRAAEELGWTLGTGCVMLGNRRTDVEAAGRAGCPSILVRTGTREDLADLESWPFKPSAVVENLPEAVALLERMGERCLMSPRVA